MKKFFIFVILYSFLNYNQAAEALEFFSSKESLADKITHQVAIKLEKEKNLHVRGNESGIVKETDLLGVTMDDFESPEKKQKLDMAINEFVESINAKGKIRKFVLNCDYYKLIGIEEGRELLVTTITEFANAVNTDRKIKKHLYNPPLEAKNIAVRIFIQNPNVSELPYGRLAILYAIEGDLKYTIEDPKTGSSQIIYREAFEDALEKLKNQQKTL